MTGRSSGLVDPRHWPSRDDPLPLTAGHVHLWSVDLDAVDPVGRQLPLNAQERARAAAFHFPHHARRFAVAHWMRRSILSRYLGKTPAAIGFRTGPNGRPELDGCTSHGLRFNASRSEGSAVLAVTIDTDIGVDVEIPRAFPDRSQVARHVFHPREWRAIEALASHTEREAAFYRCWTCKEALAKGLGIGLDLPFDRFAVDVTGAAEPAVAAIEPGVTISPSWVLRDLSSPPHMYGALAMLRRPQLVTAWSWRP